MTLKRRSEHAEDCITNVKRSLQVETNLSLQKKSDKGLTDNLKASGTTIVDLVLLDDDHNILLPQRTHLRHHDGNQAAICGRFGAGNRGYHHLGWNSDFLSLFQLCHFA